MADEKPPSWGLFCIFFFAFLQKIAQKALAVLFFCGQDPGDRSGVQAQAVGDLRIGHFLLIELENELAALTQGIGFFLIA